MSPCSKFGQETPPQRPNIFFFFNVKARGSPVVPAEVRLKWRVEAGVVQASKPLGHSPYYLDTSGAADFRFLQRLGGRKKA